MLRFSVMLLIVSSCGGGKGGGLFDGALEDGGSGIRCGGFAGTQCPANEWCDFDRNDCGGTDATGICRTRPTACPDVFDPVCACDNQVHSNACDAQAAGQDLDASGSCPVEASRFACGFRQCDRGSSFCHVFGDDTGGPDVFECAGFPSECADNPSCACLQAAQVACAEQCEGSAATGLTVTCFGG